MVGRLGAPYGVRGWLHVQSFTSPPENLLDYRPWMLRQGKNAWTSAPLAECRVHKKGYVAKFDGVDERDGAAALTGSLIGVERGALPPTAADEFYWRDLEGCAVDTTAGDPLGEITALMETGAHDVLVIRHADGEEILVPFADEYVMDVDLEARRVVVDWQADW